MDPSKKVPDLNCEVSDMLLEVVDLKQEVPDLGSSKFNPYFRRGDRHWKFVEFQVTLHQQVRYRGTLQY